MALFAPHRRSVAGGEDGGVLVEYALLIAFIAALCIAAVTVVGEWAVSNLDSAADLL
ncbi:MAG: Flp family type IVb pilin [Acidimicrobiales bacterium]